MAAASAAVNTFQTVTQTVSTGEVVVYTAPVGYTGVVLLAQCTNMGSTTYTMTLQFRREGTDVPLISEVPIPQMIQSIYYQVSWSWRLEIL